MNRRRGNVQRRIGPEEKNEQAGLTSIQQSIFLLVNEQYRSIRGEHQLAVQTAHRTLQFMAIAVAAIGGIAMNFLLEGGAKVWLTSLLFLAGIPFTIAVLYLAWLREMQRLVRSSIYLLEFEGKFNLFLETLNNILNDSQTINGSIIQKSLINIINMRPLTWEIWLRGDNSAKFHLADGRIYIVISLVLFIISILSATFGLFVSSVSLNVMCNGLEETVLFIMLNLVNTISLFEVLNPMNIYEFSQGVCSQKFIGVANFYFSLYILVWIVGVTISIYATYLLLNIRRLTRNILQKFYS